VRRLKRKRRVVALRLWRWKKSRVAWRKKNGCVDCANRRKRKLGVEQRLLRKKKLDDEQQRKKLAVANTSSE
jgi:hypothetical protein